MGNGGGQPNQPAKKEAITGIGAAATLDEYREDIERRGAPRTSLPTRNGKEPTVGDTIWHPSRLRAQEVHDKVKIKGSPSVSADKLAARGITDPPPPEKPSTY